jgi:hypothetical protein
VKKTNKNSKQYLALSIDPASINSEKKQFSVVVATETPVFRRGWDENFFEILVCNKDNMRTQRMDNGVCPLLDNHDQYTGVTKQYGSLIAYEVDNGEIRAVMQFSKDPAKDGIWKDIEAGIIRGISARYIPWVYSREIVADRNEPNYRAIDWEITEVSLAPVPADYNSMVRSNEPQAEQFEVVINNFSKTNTRSNMEEKKPGEGAQQQPNTPEGQEQARSQGNGNANTTVQNPVNVEQIRAQAQAEERTRANTIRTAVRTAGLEEVVAEELINNGSSIDVARGLIFDKMAAKQATQQPAPAGARVNANGADERDQIRNAMESVILHRTQPGSVKLEGKAVDMRGMKLLDMARHMLQLNGENPYRFSQNETVARAIATTDFPDLLSTTLQRQLRRFFEAVNSNWQKLGTQTNVSDFRTKTGVQVDGNVSFEKIAEGGEYKSAKIIQNSKATIAVETFGRLIKITRQAIINDDLDVFSRVPKMFAQGARDMQSKMFWAMITGNVKTPDGVVLFNGAHNNLAAAGAVLSETTLNDAIVAMAKQQSPSGLELGLAPKYLIVPVELEVAARKLLTNVVATKTGDVNPFYNAFEVVSEVRLSRADSKAWYMAADPAAVEGLMYAYLDGEEGLYTETRKNFDDDSVETKARLEFGVAAWEYRGWYKNPGQ